MIEMAIVGICLILNAFLAAFEMAFVTVTRQELRGLASSGHARARKLLELRDRPERTLSIIQIGITLVGALAAAVGGAGAVDDVSPYLQSIFDINPRYAEGLALVLVVSPLTLLNVVVGELVPKTLALKNPLKLALYSAELFHKADKVLSPLVVVLEWLTKQILRPFGKKLDVQEGQATEETVEVGNLSPIHKEYVFNMLDIEHKRIRDIMHPWDEIRYVNYSDTLENVANSFFTTGHTRFPVMDAGEVVGIINSKEFFTYREMGGKSWEEILRPVIRARPQERILSVLRRVQNMRGHMAIIYGSTGTAVGIITVEDIIEEIIGDIYDEDEDNRVRRIYMSKSKFKKMKGILDRPRSTDL